jgi:hypothetical protein
MKKNNVINITQIVFGICLLASCANINKQTQDLKGKWYSLSNEDYEYVEYDISDNTIGVYSHYMGNVGNSDYIFKDDTLIFRDNKLFVQWVSDDQIDLISDSEVNVLYRLSDTITTYNSHMGIDEGAFNVFYGKFEERAHNAWIKHGYFTTAEIEESYVIHQGLSFILSTDSTSLIEWGDGNYKNVTNYSIPNHLIEKTWIYEKNTKYIILKTNTGSDSRTISILPMEEGMVEKIYYNDLLIDLDKEIIVYEASEKGFPLIAEHFRTGSTQPIGVDWPECESVFPHYCVENIVLNGDVLQITWSVPHKLDKSKISKIYEVILEL